MHELEIAQSLLRTISDWRDQNGAPDVLSVRIELGPLSGVDPDAMRYAWDALRRRADIREACRLYY